LEADLSPLASQRPQRERGLEALRLSVTEPKLCDRQGGHVGDEPVIGCPVCEARVVAVARVAGVDARVVLGAGASVVSGVVATVPVVVCSTVQAGPPRQC
jgi:DNA-binding helix-hairpin-helix protein with protein kinase domain